MERLIKEEPVDKEKALGSMTSVKDSIIRTHGHLKETGGHMENSISILGNIVQITKDLKVSSEYSEVLKENPDFMEGLLDEVLDVNLEFWKKIMENKWVKIDDTELKALQTRQKIVTKARLRKRIIQFDKFKIFIKDLIAKTQDLGDIVQKIRTLRENLTSAKEENKRAQQDQETSIDLMETLCDEFDEKEKIDELTGLGSKKYFENMGWRFIEENKDFHVVFIDLNGLWVTNNTYGHDAGDSLLRDFSKDLANVLWNGKNTPFRLHGDEFVIITENGLDDIRYKMEKLTEWLKRRHYKIMSEWKVIHIEWWFAYWISEREEWDDLMLMKSKAEKSMYIHKARMKWDNKYEFWNKE